MWFFQQNCEKLFSPWVLGIGPIGHCTGSDAHLNGIILLFLCTSCSFYTCFCVLAVSPILVPHKGTLKGHFQDSLFCCYGLIHVSSCFRQSFRWKFKIWPQGPIWQYYMAHLSSSSVRSSSNSSSSLDVIVGVISLSLSLLLWRGCDKFEWTYCRLVIFSHLLLVSSALPIVWCQSTLWESCVLHFEHCV